MSHTTPVAIIMLLVLTTFSILGVLIITPPVPCAPSTSCGDGRVCPAHFLCCESGCCTPPTPPPRREVEDALRVYGHPWYTQWPVLFLLGTLGGILMCCIYCLFLKRSPPRPGVYMCSLVCCVPRPRTSRDSTGSLCVPPRYSRCGSFHTAPPPYSEVTSKPDLYPLVITCGEGEGKAAGSYLMVHYFRNYVIRTPGSLSAASTAESISSSYLCNAANEANTIVPPPYSPEDYEACERGDHTERCDHGDPGDHGERGDHRGGCTRGLLRSLSTLTEPRPRRAPTAPLGFRDNLITSPVQPLEPGFDLELELIDCEMYCDGGCKPRVGASPPPGATPSPADAACEREASALRRLFQPEPDRDCVSPPQPTSPTQSRDSTLQRPIKSSLSRSRKSVYLPLHSGAPKPRAARSEPATPSGLVPGLLTFSQRASRHPLRFARGQESDPLLAESEQPLTDHKF